MSRLLYHHLPPAASFPSASPHGIIWAPHFFRPLSIVNLAASGLDKWERQRYVLNNMPSHFIPLLLHALSVAAVCNCGECQSQSVYRRDIVPGNREVATPNTTPQRAAQPCRAMHFCFAKKFLFSTKATPLRLLDLVLRVSWWWYCRDWLAPSTSLHWQICM